MEAEKLTMEVLSGKYGVCRLEKDSPIPQWALKGDFFSITKTSDELSVVCSEGNIPGDIRCEKDWKILKILGPLDFALTGILASVSAILARAEISIFALSTYDTDYILVKDKDVVRAMAELNSEGYDFIS
ncbi:MAG: ACT domain-containing protein [Clostridiales bacterium]|nr:ACT domain-containing protein [Clostridiales bacterium]